MFVILMKQKGSVLGLVAGAVVPVACYEVVLED